MRDRLRKKKTRRLSIEAKEVLREARRRYGDLAIWDRPNLDMPASLCGMFWPEELLTLAKSGAWPLEHAALDFISGERDTPER